MNQKKADLIHEKRFAMLLDYGNLSKEKKQLLVNAFKSKFKKLSDDTKVACKPWHEIKGPIMYVEQSKWATELESKDREVLERLTVAQTKQGNMEALSTDEDYEFETVLNKVSRSETL